MFADNNAYGEAKIDRNVGNASRGNENKARSPSNHIYLNQNYVYFNQNVLGITLFCQWSAGLRNSKNKKYVVEINHSQQLTFPR